MDILIDTRGFSCPQPVLMVLERIKRDAPGVLEVLTDNDAARENVARAGLNRGYTVAESSDAPGVTRLRMEKAS